MVSVPYRLAAVLLSDIYRFSFWNRCIWWMRGAGRHEICWNWKKIQEKESQHWCVFHQDYWVSNLVLVLMTQTRCRCLFHFFHGWLWSSLSRWRTNPDVSVSLCFSSTGFFSQTSFQTRPFWICSCKTLRRLLTGHALILNLDRQVMLNTHVHFLDSLIPSAALCLFRPPPKPRSLNNFLVLPGPRPHPASVWKGGGGGAALGKKMELGPLPPTEANATEGWCFSATSQPPTPHPLSKRAGALHPTPSRPPSTPSVCQSQAQVFINWEISFFTSESSPTRVDKDEPSWFPRGGGKNQAIPESNASEFTPDCLLLLPHKLVLLPFTSAVFPLKRRDNCCNNARWTHDGTIFSAIGYCECHLGQICSYLI